MPATTSIAQPAGSLTLVGWLKLRTAAVGAEKFEKKTVAVVLPVHSAPMPILKKVNFPP